MARISTKAVVLSGLLDLAVSLTIGIGLAAVFAVARGWTELPTAELEAALASLMTTSRTYLLCASAFGVASSVLAGYVAASIAKRDWLVHGALSATACTLLAVYGIAVGTSTHSVVLFILMLPLGPMFGTLGGYLRLRREAGVGSA